MRIGVIGAGSWGTALAKLLAERGHDVALWAFEPSVSHEIATANRNSVYLPGVHLPPLAVSHCIADVVADCRLIFSVVPSHVVRSIWAEVALDIADDARVVSATKGLERGTLSTMAQVIGDELADESRVAVLSGPSFAAEVARGTPTAVVVAAGDLTLAQQVQQAAATDRFRVYTSTDLVGVQLGGAIKNVIAIAAGIADGLGFGHNTRAAVITRGLAEMTRLAVAAGAAPLTLAGLAGMGDLVLTCTADLSRNRQVGLRLGRGDTLQEIQRSTPAVAEGVNATRTCLDLAAGWGVEMPIAETVSAVLHHGLAPSLAAEQLMGRRLRAECSDDQEV